MSPLQEKASRFVVGGCVCLRRPFERTHNARPTAKLATSGHALSSAGAGRLLPRAERLPRRSPPSLNIERGETRSPAASGSFSSSSFLCSRCLSLQCARSSLNLTVFFFFFRRRTLRGQCAEYVPLSYPAVRAFNRFPRTAGASFERKREQRDGSGL